MTMGTPTLDIEAPREELLRRLEGVCDEQGADDAGARVAELRAWIESDLDEVRRSLATVDVAADTPMHRASDHLLQLQGKLLRPICVALAARVGTGFDTHARELAVAAELVHNATLLHDDVVDLGDTRRGRPAARLVYGNAASIYAGDWLLVQALERIARTPFPELLHRAIGVLKQMLVAESLQLARRGKSDSHSTTYFEIVEGKTASLFRWALYAGARAGGVSESGREALESFGNHVGIAFQLVDDVLDLGGSDEDIGKNLFADLREGKATYPLLLAFERDPTFRRWYSSNGIGGAAASELETAQRTARALHDTHALDDCLKLAARRSAEAIECLSVLPVSRARTALEDIARALVERRK